MRIVALIPARAGSKRVPGKNTKLLGGKPLIQWTIDAARESLAFDGIGVCTDDADLMRRLSPLVPILPRNPVPDDQPDIEWVREALNCIDVGADAFAILRPTSPFRTADTIRRAVERFKTGQWSSIRAVERVKQHPYKAWEWFDFMTCMTPLVDGSCNGTPWHSMPTQSLQPIYIQNSSLEIAHTWCVTTFGTISGPKVGPFFTEGMEGFSIDYPEDMERAEAYAQTLISQSSAML